LRSDSLFRNSFYLMVSTGVMAVLGFGFWWLCARLFSPTQIGLGTALISAMSLITYLSLLGFNSTFIRFLPKSERRNAKINTGLLLVFGAATVLAVGYVVALPTLAPKLAFVHDNLWYAAGFVLLAALAAINLLTDSVFIAYRAAKYNLLINSIMSFTKLMLPLLAVGLGAYGIFLASGAAAFLALVLSLLFMIRDFGFSLKVNVSRSVIGQVMSFASANYVANCLNILPTLVLPLIIVNRLGAAEAGYFYLAFMVANLLFTVAYSVAQSLFAEGSYSEIELSGLVKRAVAILGAIMIPAALALALSAHWLLMVFGRGYSSSASGTLVVLALSALPLAVYTVAVVLLRVRRQNYSLIAMNVLFAALISGLAWLWAPRGLPWVAVAWLLGHLVAGGFGLILAWLPHVKQGTIRNPVRKAA
jgi:O-antigen/teichoic acid export membrane protein